MRCAVIGGGAWGTALAQLLARNGHDVTLWAREPEVVQAITSSRENPLFLAGVELDARIRATGELCAAVAGAELVTYVPPSHALRGVIRDSAEALPPGVPLVVASKGIEGETLALMSEVAVQEAPGRPVVALSGPSFAVEVAAGQPTAVVAASEELHAATAVQRALSSELFRVYSHDDVIGVELGGSLKNVIAVATGICEGLGLGFNPRAAVITRGLAEMTRLGVALGASPLTFSGLAGLGDLVLTCTGAHSRNRAVGVAVGGGQSLDDALRGKHTVAEAVFTTRSARALAAREGVEMPIVEAVYRILFGGQPARQAMTELMTRGLRRERD